MSPKVTVEIAELQDKHPYNVRMVEGSGYVGFGEEPLNLPFVQSGIWWQDVDGNTARKGCLNRLVNRSHPASPYFPHQLIFLRREEFELYWGDSWTSDSDLYTK